MIKTDAANKKDVSGNTDIALYMLANNVKLDDTKKEEPVAPPVAEEEEYQGGAFSKQKGGSAALSLDAYIAAMNAQIEAVNLRRERAQSMIEMDVKTTQLAADNVILMGIAEKNGYIAQGVGSIVGGGLSLVAAGGSAAYTKFGNSTKVQEAEVSKLDNGIKGLDHMDKVKYNKPYDPTMLTDADGRVVTPRSDAVNAAIHKMTTGDKPLESTGAKTINRTGDTDLANSKELMMLDDVEYTALKQMDQGQRNDYRKNLTSQRERAQSVINNAHSDITNKTQIARMGAEALGGMANGTGSIIHGGWAAERSELEAEKMLYELTARYASQELQLNNENASQREGDIYATIRTLSQLTQADIRG